MDLFQELYDLAINEIYEDTKHVRVEISSDDIELISWNIVAQALMGALAPHLYRTYFKPGIRLLDKDEVASILAVISELINKRDIGFSQKEIIVMEKAMERLLVSQGWSRSIAWERATYLSRAFVEKLAFKCLG